LGIRRALPMVIDGMAPFPEDASSPG
jgi:hypothetical protein